MKRNTIALIAVVALSISCIASCGLRGETPSAGGQASSGGDRGIGPVKEISLGTLDPVLVAKGEDLFKTKCGACHKIEEKYVGPALKGVTQRRRPEWIMNQILNPVEMTEKDPVAKDLLGTYLVQMTFQNVTQDEARSILEFFRQNDSGADATK